MVPKCKSSDMANSDTLKRNHKELSLREKVKILNLFYVLLLIPYLIY